MADAFETALQNVKCDCPFCGSRKLGVSGCDDYTIVVCLECFAEGPHGTLTEAVERWNDRPAPPEMVTLSRLDLEVRAKALEARVAALEDVLRSTAETASAVLSDK